MPAGHQLAEKVLRASPVVRLVDSDRMISVYSTRGNVVAQVEHRLAAACFGAPCDAVLGYVRNADQVIQKLAC